MTTPLTRLTQVRMEGVTRERSKPPSRSKSATSQRTRKTPKTKDALKRKTAALGTHPLKMAAKEKMVMELLSVSSRVEK